MLIYGLNLGIDFCASCTPRHHEDAGSGVGTPRKKKENTSRGLLHKSPAISKRYRACLENAERDGASFYRALSLLGA